MANPPITSENEDLFDFDNDRHAAATPSAPVAAKPAVLQEAPSVAPTQLPPAQPLVEHVAVTRPAPPAPVVEPRPPARTERKNNLPTRALLALAILVNVALVGVVSNSMSGMRSALQEVGEIARRSNAEGAHGKSGEKAAWQELDLEKSASAEAETALTTAALEIRRGEYERARARLYSLLSVIDRFPPSARSNLAARAQVLAADAYREQADAVERQLTTAEPLGQFLEAAPEEKR
ncbi:MAG TPA: hypothetical protein VM509_12370 [Planctomycetota bacterium]|nr:hypothetical protein [Planctomycetota bacterium]